MVGGETSREKALYKRLACAQLRYNKLHTTTQVSAVALIKKDGHIIVSGILIQTYRIINYW
jgi:hypothetical protein